jgi:hypothetical protein
MMKIYLMGDSAFVDVGKGYLLCIGSKTEVDEAKPGRLLDMIEEAIAHSKWRSMESSKGMVLH